MNSKDNYGVPFYVFLAVAVMLISGVFVVSMIDIKSSHGCKDINNDMQHVPSR